jgi:hypothetical protein
MINGNKVTKQDAAKAKALLDFSIAAEERAETERVQEITWGDVEAKTKSRHAARQAALDRDDDNSYLIVTDDHERGIELVFGISWDTDRGEGFFENTEGGYSPCEYDNREDAKTALEEVKSMGYTTSLPYIVIA